MTIDATAQKITTETGLAHRVLVHSRSRAIIQAPLDKVDIPEWLFNLGDEEYQRCSVDHIAAGSNRAPNGRRMSLNVEEIGGSFIVQHYVEDITEKNHCRVISTSDVFVVGSRTTVHVAWELMVTPLTESTCQFTNIVLVHTTDNYEEFLDKNGIPFEQARAAMETAVGAHNAEETPLFAKSIEAKTLLIRL